MSLMLALLLGALALLAAAPAEAQITLVSNIGQTRTNVLDTSTDSSAHGFATGNGHHGYVLTGIEMSFRDARNSAQMATVRAELWSAASGGGPGSKIANLTAPSSIAAGANAEFTAPANTQLQPTTTYYVVLYTVGSLSVNHRYTASSNEDSGGQPGWSIEDNGWYITQDTPGTNSWSLSGGTEIFLMRVKGHPLTLSVLGSPGCGSTVSDTSVQPHWRLRSAPSAPLKQVDVEYNFVDASGVSLGQWLTAHPLRSLSDAPHGHTFPIQPGFTFAEFRQNFPGFAGISFRIKNQPAITSNCTYQFDVEGGNDNTDGGDNSDDTNTGGGTNPGGGTPETPTTPTNDGGGGGGGGGGGSGPPAQSSDASLDTLEIGGDPLNLDPDTDTYAANAYGETSLTLTPTANHPDAEITVDGETVESGADISIDLEDDGVTVIKIVVTAEDGTTKTYTLTVMSCPGEERKILEMFYDSTQGDMWEQSGGWKTEDDLRDWHGVDTDEDGNVRSLRLPDNGLSGDIPSALLCFSELSGLSELALWDNDELSREVPDDLVPAVERAVLRDVAEALNLNPGWFDDYEDPFSFSDWHSGVTTDDDERVTELDFTGEDITGVIPGSVFELKRLRAIETGCEVTLEIEAPGRVSVMTADGCPEETEPEDMEETAASGDGGCALGRGDSSVSGFGLFLVTLLVFAALGKRKARG